MTEQRPLAAVLGAGLDLRLLGYRDYTPLRNGQVDDEPYGGGAGMLLRVDVVAAALDAVYGGVPSHPVIALTPQGRQLTQELVEELAGEERLTLLSSRFEGFDERIVEHLCSDAISIGPYVLSGGELPALVLVDAIARRLPGALAEGSGERESFSSDARRRARAPALHAPARVPRLGGARGAALGRPRAHRVLAAGARPMRDPLGRLFPNMPHGWRVALDWIFTIVGAIAVVLVIKAYVVNPYRIPSSSMEPTLHCARPGAGCEARFSDRVLANRFIYRFRTRNGARSSSSTRRRSRRRAAAPAARS